MKKHLILIAALFVSSPVFADWDVSTPNGSEAKSLGDDRIRELKTDIGEALEFGGVFPGADATNPRYFYTPSTGTTAFRPTGDDRTTGMLYINKSSGVIEQYNGASWDIVAVSTKPVGVGVAVIPTGSKIPFFQASCPDGWTQDTSAGGRVLRSTNSAGGGVGGSTDISTATFAHSHTVNSHTHDLANHTHTTPAHQHQLDYDSSSGDLPPDDAVGTKIYSLNSDGSVLGAGTSGTSGVTFRQIKNQTENSGSGTSGAPNTNTSGSTAPGTDTQGALNVAYANIIICTAP